MVTAGNTGDADWKEVATEEQCLSSASCVSRASPIPEGEVVDRGALAKMVDPYFHS
jgi:hypothetical protein